MAGPNARTSCPYTSLVIPRIAPHAFKHGIAEEDIMHAYRNPMRIQRQGERLLLVGGDRAGRMLQIGVEEGDEQDVILHAMPALEKNLL